VVAALLLRNGGQTKSGTTPVWLRLAGGVLAFGAIGGAARIAEPLYRAEALRFEHRRAIDKQARGQGNLDRILPPALAAFQETVKIDPTNGQAWADLSYAIGLSWHVTQGNITAIGRRAEQAAREALARSAAVAEFWVFLGIALDMQARQLEAEPCFRRAVDLAPTRAEWRYYLAYHLSARKGREGDALEALETCLALDPTFRQAESLRAKLSPLR
jgi:tetratricopeptide (TPR) repeat protein